MYIHKFIFYAIVKIHTNNINEGGVKMTTVQKWGGSLGVRIPSNIAKRFNINDGSQVEIKEIDGVIVIEPIRETLSLNDLVAQIDEDNRHEAIEWVPKGKEML